MGEGRGRESNLENSSIFPIYTIKNPTFDTPHFGRGQNRKVNFCPSHLLYPYPALDGGQILKNCLAPKLSLDGGGNLENSSRFCIYTIKNPTCNTPHFGKCQNRKINFCPSPLPHPSLHSSRFRIYTIKNTFDTQHFGRGQNRKVNFCHTPLPCP